MLCVVKKRKEYFPKTLSELKRLCDLGIPLWKIDFPSEIISIRRLFYESPRTHQEYEGIEEWNLDSVLDYTSAFEKAYGFNRSLNGFKNAKILDNCFKNARNFQQSFVTHSFLRLKSAENALTNTKVDENKMGKLAFFGKVKSCTSQKENLF